MDVEGPGDTGFCQLHDTKNTKDFHKGGTDMTTNYNPSVTQLCNTPWTPHHTWTNYIPGPFQNGMMWPGPTSTVVWQRTPPLKERSCTDDMKATTSNPLSLTWGTPKYPPARHEGWCPRPDCDSKTYNAGLHRDVPSYRHRVTVWMAQYHKSQWLKMRKD